MNPEEIISSVKAWADVNLMTEDALTQLAVCAFILGLSYFVSVFLKSRLRPVVDKFNRDGWPHLLLGPLQRLIFPLAGIFLIGLYVGISSAFEWPSGLAEIAVSLLVAWFVINLAASFMGDGYLVKTIKAIVWTIFLLHAFSVLEAVLAFLEGIAVVFGETRLSVYAVLKGFILFLVLVRMTMTLSDFADKRINKARDLTPSHRVLFSKFIRIALFAVAVLIPLNVIGFDLALFAVFSGALGVGLGFGLQKIVSNFISGIILLTDRSIKPGDVIAVGDTYGWVNALSARYVSVITRDGKEHLIPNELLITDKVENWSFSNNDVRVRIPVGVSYKSDIHKVMELIAESASENPRILKDPPPRVLLRGFGDSAVNFELRIWINDPANGMGNIQSEVLINIWDKFKANGIEIPYPQRDVHVHTT